MISQLKQPDPSNTKPPNSSLAEAHKSDNLSTGASTKASFRIFGCCCRPDNEQPSSFFVNKSLAHPTSTMSSHKYKSNQNEIFDPNPIEIDPPKEYPIEQVFILGEKYKIVAKITIKKVSKPTSILQQVPVVKRMMTESVRGAPVKKSNSQDKEGILRQRTESAVFGKELPLQIKKEIFSKYEKGIKAEQWQEITPEKVAMHVADRLRCDTIIDALCGFGGNAIQFAKTCNFVIGIDIQGNKTSGARHNARVYNVEHKIDFITGDFMKIQNITADVVFLGPTYEIGNPDEPFSIFKNVQPDPLNLLAKSLEVSYKIAIQFPGDTQLEELPRLFNESLEKYGLYSKRFCIEIEKIVNSFNETECIIVYFGDCSSITLKEEYEAIYEYIGQTEIAEWKEEFPLQIVTAIVQKVGILRTFRYISEIESHFTDQGLPVICPFDNYLNKVIQANIFTKAYVEKIIEEADRKFEWASMNIQNSHNSSSLPIEKPFSKKVEQESHLMYKIGSEVSPNQKKPIGLLSKLMVEPQTKKPANTLQTKIPSNDEKTPTPNSIQEFIGTFKDSYELSDLPVSSYSVSSDYLKDFSEDEFQSRKMTETINDLKETSGMDSARLKGRTSNRFSKTPTAMKLSEEERRHRLDSKLKGEIVENRKSLQLPRKKSTGIFRSVTTRDRDEGENSDFLFEGEEGF